MVEERRAYNRNLEDRLDAHIKAADVFVASLKDLSFKLPSGLTAEQQIARSGKLEEDRDLMLDEMLGKEDPLTKVRSGGMRGAIGESKLAIDRLEYMANNGGVNAKVRLTNWQKGGIAALPVATGGAFAIALALIERM
jgi:hypothetical protein